MTGGRPDVLIIAPVMAQDVRHYARALADAGRLRLVLGGLAYHDRGVVAAAVRLFDRWGGGRLVGRTEARRVRDELPAAAFRPTRWPELAVLAASLLTGRPPTVARTDWTLAVLDRSAARLLRPTDRLVIGREDACVATFRAARRAGVRSLYDLPTAVPAAVAAALAVEAARFPGADTHASSAKVFAPARLRRKAEELALADRVLVPSDYVRRGLVAAGYPADKVTLLPFGCDPGREYHPYAARKPVILYVGQINVRKGVPRLLSVWKRLAAHRTHTLRLVGRQQLTPGFLADYAGLYEHVPAVPRSQLAAHYRAAAGLVMPSSCEGFAMVINEALSHGTPVVASSNSGAKGFVNHGVEGLTYEHGDDDALATHLDQLLSRRVESADMSRAAYALAQRWTWAEYRAAFLTAVGSLTAARAAA